MTEIRSHKSQTVIFKVGSIVQIGDQVSVDNIVNCES